MRPQHHVVSSKAPRGRLCKERLLVLLGGRARVQPTCNARTPRACSKVRGARDPVIPGAPGGQDEAPGRTPNPDVPRPRSISVEGIEFVLLKGGRFIPGCVENCGAMAAVQVNDLYVGRFEVTQGQFARFVRETKRPMTRPACWNRPRLDGQFPGKADWRFPHGWDEHPVVCVTQTDAMEFARWLSARSGYNIRLPTSIEWEYAARSGGKPVLYAWGNDWPPPVGAANLADRSAMDLAYETNETTPLEDYWDTYPYSAPVGSFRPSEAGLYDMSGNVNEWISDECAVRGGSWDNPKRRLQTIHKAAVKTCEGRWTATGFRLVMDPIGAEAPAARDAPADDWEEARELLRKHFDAMNSCNMDDFLSTLGPILHRFYRVKDADQGVVRRNFEPLFERCEVRVRAIDVQFRKGEPEVKVWKRAQDHGNPDRNFCICSRFLVEPSPSGRLWITGIFDEPHVIDKGCTRKEDLCF